MSNRRTALTLFVVLLVGISLAGISTTAWAQAPARKATLAPRSEAAEYVGLTKCAACHFDQYKDWKISPHARAFDILPTKYRQDAECLKCHTTGSELALGSRDPSNAHLAAGISCEACHGPGGAHAKQALRIVDEGITEAGMSRLRASIQRLALDECIKCHISKAHKRHPPFDRDESAIGRDAKPTATRPTSFFSFRAHDEQPRP